jgi:oligopeptide/dipeptide ABC transporter ATP-binding protein
MSTPLLEVRDLCVDFDGDRGRVRALNGISFEVAPGEVLGIVGESGCGKSVTSLALLGLIPSPPGRIAGGSIRLDGRDITNLRGRELRQLRGHEIAMIFQEPMTALNPVYTVGSQMIDVLRRYRRLNRRQAREAALAWLERVGIPSPAERIDDYPHQLSGGMRQRVMIAMALSCEPRLIIADEPTTALDVTIQAQVLDLMTSLVREQGAAMILITHDLGVVAETCDRACVMYCGEIVEQSRVDELFAAPRHPYTAGLLASVPRVRSDRQSRLPTISGIVPDLASLPDGCRFHDRCPRAQARCRHETPLLRRLGEGSARAACHFPLEAIDHGAA